MATISIIIPIYNCEKYLIECLDSIKKQDFEDYEVLLIDDASSDTSPQICDKYAGMDKRFIAVHNAENRGISQGRNCGLEKATGEYIMFVDSDDYLPSPSVLSLLYKKTIENDVDIVVGNYERFWEGRYLPATGHESYSMLDRDSMDFRFQGFFSVGTLSYVWCKLYRAKFLEENNIEFLPANYAEDKLFNFMCYVKGAKYDFVDDLCYAYRKNDDSASFKFRENCVEDWMYIANSINEILVEKEADLQYGDITGNTIFFGAFFDGKMFYEFKGKKISSVKCVLKKYASYPLAKKYFKKFGVGKGVSKISSTMYKIMIRGFCFAMCLHMYSPLSIGIKLIVDRKIDEKLSDTGMRDKEDGI